MSDDLTPGQQVAYDRIVANAAEVMLGHGFDFRVDENHLRASGHVIADTLRKMGVPAVRAEMEVVGGRLVASVFIVDPRGYG